MGLVSEVQRNYSAWKKFLEQKTEKSTSEVTKSTKKASAQLSSIFKERTIEDSEDRESRRALEAIQTSQDGDVSSRM